MGFFDSLFGGGAGGDAARDTYRRQHHAIQDYNHEGDQYAGQMAQLAKMFEPYGAAGKSALSQLMNGLGLSGKDGSAAFTNAFHSLPGYQSGLNTGIHAANSTANAGGMLNSGAAMKALDRFGSDYENQRSGDYLTRLTGLAGMGEQATGQQVATTGQGLTGKLNQRGGAFTGQMQAAGTLGQGMVADAQAQSQGINNLMGMGMYGVGAAMGSPWLGSAMGFGQQQPQTNRTSGYGGGTSPYQNTFMGPR